MVTALAGLEAGVITPEDTFYCPGHTEVGSRRFHCWKRGGHGYVNLRDSLKSSCDVYYYDIAQRTGIDRISEMCNRLGLGVEHDLPMTSVSKGLAPTREWKLESKGSEWSIVYIPFADMVPTYRGFVMDVESVNAKQVGSFGFMLTDKQEGEFELLVDWIRLVNASELEPSY